MSAVLKSGGQLEASLAKAKNDVSAAPYIPYAAHVSPSVIKLRDNGDLACTWKLHGMSFETASPDEIGMAKKQLVNFLHSIRGTDMAEPTALWVHRVRRKMTDQLQADFPNDFAREVDRKYWARMGNKTMLRNELYLTLIVRPTHSATASVKRERLSSAEALMEFDRQALSRMEVLCGQVTTSMEKFGGYRLSCGQRTSKTGNVLVTSPTLSFYRWLLTGVSEEVVVQPGRIAEYLNTARIFAGNSNGVIQLNHPERRSFVGYLDFKDYPAITEPGLNNCLFAGSYEFVETQSFSFLTKREGVDALELQQRLLSNSGEGSPEQISEMFAAIEDVRNGRVFMGEYHYTLGVYGDNVVETQKNMSMARTALQEDAGYDVATVDLIPDCAHFAQLPGNWKWRPREAKLTTRNFASLSPLHNFDMGKRDGNPWGQAVTLLDTPTLQPFYFNFHESPIGKDSVGDKLPGNTFVCGMTGAGKSVWMGFMLLQLSKVRNLRILFFDKDRGGELLIRAMGGRYKQMRRGQPTGFNPFQWEPTARNIQFVKQLVGQCAVRGDETLDVRLENALSGAIDRVFSLPRKQDRRISAVLQFVGKDSELGDRLAKWCRTQEKTGANAWVLDNETDTTSFKGASIFGYDYTDFLGDPECGPIILSYILEAADTLLDGMPFCFVMEEFAKMVAAKSQTLVEFARDKQTTIRKLNGFGIFVTQSPSQVNDYPIGSTLREQCPTQIFLPNPRAEYADYVDGFKLTPTEFVAIKELALDSRMFLVKQGHRSAMCRLDLGGMRDELEIISGSMDNVLLLDQLREELGSDDPAVWMQPLLARVATNRSKTAKKPTAT